MEKMIATKRYRYNRRDLRPGDEFEAPWLHARMLEQGKRAKPASDAPPVLLSDIDQLRAEAKKLGLAIDGRWGVRRLQQELVRAKA